MSEAVEALLSQMSLNRERIAKSKIADQYALTIQLNALLRELMSQPWDEEYHQLVAKYEKGEFV